MALQMIQNTATATCNTDYFLNQLICLEEMDCRYGPPSPVFNIPTDPPVENNNDIYYRYYLTYPIEFNKEEYHYSKIKNKIHNKNHNQHLRKMGRLKQPGGSSCNQRR